MKRHSGLLVSRYGRVSAKKQHGEDFQTVFKKSTKVNKIHKTLALTTKADSSLSVSNHSSVRNTKARKNDYSVGDLVWAKIGKYPVWPGIIISDPESNKTFKSKY